VALIRIFGTNSVSGFTGFCFTKMECVAHYDLGRKENHFKEL